MRRLTAACATVALILPVSVGLSASASADTGVPMPPPPIAGATSTGEAGVVAQTALSAEQQQAAASGRSVSAGVGTETDTVVNPDGSTTVDLYSAPQNVEQGGNWVPVNTRLTQNADGSFSTVATDASTTFSGGGSSAVATTADNGTSVGLGFGSNLPKPTVSGSTATYSNVLANTDLVVTATDGGFEYSLVIKKRPSSVPSFTLPLSAHGLTISQDPSTGALSMRNSSGKALFASAVPVMFGATLDPHSSMPTESEALTTALVQTANGPALKVTPDWAFLSNPNVTYPVTIDPNATESVAHYDYTSSLYPTNTNYYDNSISENGATGIVHVGTYDSGTDQNRGYFSFPTSPLLAHTVSSADLYIKEVWAYSCTAEQVDVHEQPSNFSSSLTWNNQPSLGPTVSSATVAKGYSSSCPAGNVDFSATSLAHDWASGSGGQQAVVVTANNGTNNLYWKKFDGTSAYVAVTYANTPTAPTSLAVTPNSGSIAASWGAPSSNGGASITGYTVKYVPGSGTTVTHNLSSTARSDSATGLINGTIYTVSVTATNSEGTGPATSAAATPSTYPSAVTSLSLGGGNNRVYASWTAPSNNGGLPVSAYMVYLYPAGSSYSAANWISYKFVTSTSTSVQAGDGSVCNGGGTCPPANGTAYDVEVFPYNGSSAQITGEGAGYGPGAVSGSATAENYPSAPQNASLSVSNGSVAVSWTAPSNTGGPGVALNGYVVYVYPSGTSYPSAPASGTLVGPNTTSTTITGLSNGTSYMAYVWAGNNSIETTTTDGSATAAGYGPATKTGFNAPAGLPGTAANVSADKTNANGNVINDGFIVSWDSPSGDGAPIGKYLVRTYLCTTVNASSCSLDPLHPTLTVSPNGQTGRQHSATISAAHLGYYAFDVAADNTTSGNGATGQGSWSGMTAPQSNYGIPLFNPGTVTAATNGSRSATVAFTPSLADAAAYAVTSYTVTGYTASDNVARPRITATIPANTPPGGTLTNPSYQVTLNNVVNGVPVYWTVNATESISILGQQLTFGSATSSPSNTLTTSGVPFSPTAVAGQAGYDAAGDVTVSWTPPASRLVDPSDYAQTPGNNGSAVLDYTATASPGGASTTTSATSAVISGLSDGTSYTFTVTARNANGSSAPSAASAPVLVAEAPEQPTNLAATATDTTATVTWTASITRGAPVLAYDIDVDPGTGDISVDPGSSCAGGTCSYTLTSLSPGTDYDIRVRATSVAGNSPFDEVDVTTLADPSDAPSNVVASPGESEAIVSWSKPATHGSAIDHYTVTSSPGGITATTTSRSVTVSGLQDGTIYTFTVVATTRAGADSAPSLPSNPVTPSATSYQGSSGTRAESAPPANSLWLTEGLGDSYSSGEGNEPFLGISDSDGCHRSGDSWESHVTDDLFNGGVFDFIACSGAKSSDLLTNDQGCDTDTTCQQTHACPTSATDCFDDTNNGQVSHLSDGDNIVLVSIGGDDVGFHSTLQSCVEQGLVEEYDPISSPSHCSTLDNEQQTLSDYQQEGHLLTDYETMAARSPHSLIYVLTYPQIFRGTSDGTFTDPTAEDCSGAPFTASDEDEMRGYWTELDNDIRSDVAQAAAIYPNLRVISDDNAFAHHYVCENPNSDVHGLHYPSNKEFSFHPTAAGQLAMANVAEPIIEGDLAPPSVTKVANDPSQPGYVDITGQNLDSGSQTQVYFGGVATDQPVQIVDNQHLVVHVPAIASGTVDVVVQTNQGPRYGTSPVVAADQYHG